MFFPNPYNGNGWHANSKIRCALCGKWMDTNSKENYATTAIGSTRTANLPMPQQQSYQCEQQF